MLDYKIEINDNIIVTIKKPKGTVEEDIETLESLKKDLDLKSFIDWIDWMPVHPRDEEWAYWEAKAGTISPLGAIRFELQNTINELKKENKELREENKSLLKQVEKYGNIISTKSWPAKSREIALEEENQKLKNRLSAYESHDKRKKPKKK
jgi:hypothetical protein